ncbi:MAG: hypothetical protein AAF639_11505 [Chloroflexota bacterium]
MNTDDNPAGEVRALNSLNAQGVDGIIGFLYNIPENELRRFADQGKPMVLRNDD